MWPRDTAKDHASPSVKQYLRVLSESRRTQVPVREECFVSADIHIFFQKFLYVCLFTLIDIYQENR